MTNIVSHVQYIVIVVPIDIKQHRAFDSRGHKFVFSPEDACLISFQKTSPLAVTLPIFQATKRRALCQDKTRVDKEEPA